MISEKTVRDSKQNFLVVPVCQYMMTNRKKESSQCKNTGMIEINGKNYCVIHVKLLRKLMKESEKQ